MTEYEGRHARPEEGRHSRPEWDAADELAVNLGNTPPMEWPAVTPPPPPPPPVQVHVPVYVPVPTPPQGLPRWARWSIAGAAAMAGGLVVLFALLAVALSMAPDTAVADERPAPVEHRVEQVTAGENLTVRVAVAGDRVRVESTELCPHEDSCTANYSGDGYTIEKVKVNP